MQSAMVVYLFMVYLYTNFYMYSQLNCQPFQIVFYRLCQCHKYSCRGTGWGWCGATKWLVNPPCKLKTAKQHQLVLFFSAPHNTKTAKSMVHHTSHTCGDLQPAVCLFGEIRPFKDNTHEHLTSLRNKLQQKQPWQL